MNEGGGGGGRRGSGEASPEKEKREAKEAGMMGVVEGKRCGRDTGVLSVMGRRCEGEEQQQRKKKKYQRERCLANVDDWLNICIYKI